MGQVVAFPSRGFEQPEAVEINFEEFFIGDLIWRLEVLGFPNLACGIRRAAEAAPEKGRAREELDAMVDLAFSLLEPGVEPDKQAG